MISFFQDLKDPEAFALWAFGEDYQKLEKGVQFLNAWNRLHDDVLRLNPVGVISEDSKKMKELWMSSQSPSGM